MEPGTLDQLPDGALGTIVSMDLPSEALRYIASMGIAPGRELRVLRRAVWGGPLHVRLDTGAEFALDREIARSVTVARAAE